MQKNKNYIKNFFLLLLLFTGIILRIYLAYCGYNYDIDSYWIVANIVDKGGNVYEETFRYNYGFIWFNILYIILKISKNFRIFRLLITIFLTFIDTGIFIIILKKYGKIPAFLFFLNFISILITGYHGQFDNFAILIGMLSVIVFGEDFSKNITKRKILGLILLSISLITKHIFFIFPLWLAARQKGLLNKLLIIILPVLLFLLSFLPYWSDGKSGIIKNVFLYRGFNNAPFCKVAIPYILFYIISEQFFSRIIFIGFLILGAFIFRKTKLMDSLLIYTLVLVIFSPTMTNQYLAIVVPAISVFPNIIYIFYTLISTLCLIGSGSSIKFNLSNLYIPEWLIWEHSGVRIFDLPILVLFSGFLLMCFKNQVKDILKKGMTFLVEEFLYQIAK